ncbi:MAG TPA: polysaccharide biosynthesis protein [Candidatus Coprocola pullicola]|nr:polysaccharide biosynthesis protein [Candidatus Coprocola pullicola]
MTRKKGGSFVKQAAILAFAGIMVRVFGFLYRIPMTNMIGDAGNAIYSAGYYIYTFLLILSSAGLPAAISKMVSERLAVGEYRNAHKVFRVSLFVSGSLGFICMILMFVFAQQIATVLAKSPESYYCILTLSPTLFIVAIMSAYRGYFQGMNTMLPTALSQIMEQIFNAFFSVYLAYVLLGYGVDRAAGEKNIIMGAAGGTAGTGIGALAGLLVIMFSYMLLKPVIYKKTKKEKNRKTAETAGQIAKILLTTALPIIAGTAVFSITNLIDMNMVMRILEGSGHTHQQAQDLYGQLSGKYVTLTTLPVSISTAVATAAIPSIAASARLRQKQQVKRKMNMTLRVSMIISVPAGVGIGVLGDSIVKMLFPHATEGGILLTVGSVSIIFLALCQTVTGVLQGIGHVKIPVIGAILGAIVKVILNALLIGIPSINVIGAVISTTGCYMVASLFNLCMLSRIMKVHIDLLGSLFKPLIGSFVMGVVCFLTYKGLFALLNSNTFATIFAIMIGVIIYGLVMLLIGGIKEADLMTMPMGGRLVRICRACRLM